MSTQKTSHLERTAAEPRAKELYETKLARIDEVNDRVRLFRLELLSGPTEFLPGQWLDTFVPGTPKAGGFTITSPPSAASGEPCPYLELAVQESPDNLPAAWLWRPRDEILGATLKVRIGGSFVFPPPGLDVGSLRSVVFVAGGVGINPLMSMLSYMGEKMKEFSRMEVRLAYASKMPSGGLGKVVFLDRITRLFGEGKVKGSIDVFATGSSEEVPGDGRRDMNGTEARLHGRRLSIADLKALIDPGAHDLNSTIVYVCGPPTMTDELVATLTSKDGLGMDPKRVMTEKWW